jgi:hypothetical protein
MYDFPDLNRVGFHEEDLVQHVLFDTGRRRTRPGILKKRGEAEPSQDDEQGKYYLDE